MATDARPGQHRRHARDHAVHDAPPGTANDTLNRAAYRLGTWVGAGLLAHDNATGTLIDAARARRIPHREALGTIRSGITAGCKRPVEARDA